MGLSFALPPPPFPKVEKFFSPPPPFVSLCRAQKGREEGQKMETAEFGRTESERRRRQRSYSPHLSSISLYPCISPLSHSTFLTKAEESRRGRKRALCSPFKSIVRRGKMEATTNWSYSDKRAFFLKYFAQNGKREDSKKMKSSRVTSLVGTVLHATYVYVLVPVLWNMCIATH